MDDDDIPPAHELEQLARSLSMDGALGQRDAHVVAEMLRWLAAQRQNQVVQGLDHNSRQAGGDGT